MPAYVIADLRIINRPRYDEYRLAVRDTIRGHGGRQVVLTSAVEVLEGNWEPHFLILLEFDSESAVRSGAAGTLGVNSASTRP